MNKINILTRTANRPIGFKQCENSILNQTYDNFNHIISYDDVHDLSYIGNNKNSIFVDSDNILKKYPQTFKETNHFWLSKHNLYCNELLNKVKDGYIMFLDDDDMLMDTSVLEIINKNIIDEDTMLIWKMEYPNGVSLPNDLSFKNKTINLGGIGSPCFLFHSKWKDKYKWDAYKCADFRFLNKLFKDIPNKKWINKKLIKLNNSGGFGLKKDIEYVD